MPSLSAKVAHVRQARQERPHHCHWPGCDRQAPPAKWGCKDHWFRLPAEIRTRIWRAYRVGQERDRRPSREYVAAAHQAQGWIALQCGRGGTQLPLFPNFGDQT